MPDRYRATDNPNERFDAAVYDEATRSYTLVHTRAEAEALAAQWNAAEAELARVQAEDEARLVAEEQAHDDDAG